MLEWNELNAQREDFVPDKLLYSQEDIIYQASKLHPIYLQNQEDKKKIKKNK